VHPSGQPVSQPLCMDNYTCMHRKLHKNTLGFFLVHFYIWRELSYYYYVVTEKHIYTSTNLLTPVTNDHE
jgi:hypothetical protein